MSTDASTPLAVRSPWGLALVALPLAGLAFVFVAYALTFGLGLRGRAASGAEVALAFDGCGAAEPVIAARLADMGLPTTPLPPDVAVGQAGFAFQVALPADADVAADVPGTLTAPGRLTVRGQDGEILAEAADVIDASVRMDLMMVPSALVRVGDAAAARISAYSRAHRQSTLSFEVDGAQVGAQSTELAVGPGELEIAPSLDDGKARWRAVARLSVIVDHPLPCEVTARR